LEIESSPSGRVATSLPGAVDYETMTTLLDLLDIGLDILPTSMSSTKTTTPEPPSRHSYTKDRAQLLRRLSRMEGQVRGVARMIERDEYCIDILQQTAALRAAVDAVSLLLMEDHVAGCLATAVRTGEAQTYTEEVMEVVRRSMGRPVRARTAD
jgi:CsoR family transcriptional regulator, copper-sensing transcriptional repressor